MFHEEHLLNFLKPAGECRFMATNSVGSFAVGVLSVPRGTIPTYRGTRRGARTTTLGQAFERTPVFHVDHFHRGPESTMPQRLRVQSFLVPTRMRRRREFGTGIGSFQSQPRFLRISGRSFVPIQRTTWFAARESEWAQSRNLGYSPNAREQTKSRGAISSCSSS